MIILITGATGLIGRQLALRLRRDGHQLFAWVRDEERARQQLGAEVCLISDSGARAGRGSLEDAVQRADAVVNLAGEPIAAGRWSATRKAAIYDSRINLTRRLVRAIEGAERRPEVLLSASAVGFYGDRGGETIDEASSAGEGFMAEVCRDWEHEARAAESLGVRVTIPRIGIVLARDGGALTKMLPPFRAGFGGPLGDGRQFMAWIHLHDLVEVLVTALTDRRYSGPFNATAPAPVTNRVFTKTLGRVLRRPTFFRVPGAMLSLALGKMAQVVLHGQRAEPERLVALGFSFRFGVVEEALRDLLADDDSVGIERLGADSG
ncbi:MAG: TIGR01777 family protein [Proteobacteria bacterium]|nr:MAG: TIGR01777 family protein [Pseudomonadota bacterium]